MVPGPNLGLCFHVNYSFLSTAYPSEAVYVVLQPPHKNLKLFSPSDEKEAFLIELCLD